MIIILYFSVGYAIPGLSGGGYFPRDFVAGKIRTRITWIIRIKICDIRGIRVPLNHSHLRIAT
jgi:hypothetical protein